MRKLFVILFAASIARGEQAEIITSSTMEAGIGNFVTNLPTQITIEKGVLSFRHGGTNLWVSSEAHDWGSWLPSGAENPSDDAVVVNRPLVLQPAGTQWQCVGGYAVLSLSPGATMVETGSESSVAWTFGDGSSWRWVAASQMDVPAQPQSVELVYIDDVEYLQIDYAASSTAAQLTLYMATSLAATYNAVSSAVWMQVNDATRRVVVPTSISDRGFFRAIISQSIPSHIETSGAMHIKGGVMTATDDINPVVYNAAVVVVGEDGKRYRIAAQALE